MFNPNIQFDVTKQWDRMASIYSYLPPEQKAIIETLWEAVYEGLSALYYNIAQSSLSTMVLGRSRGYLETAYQEIPLILSGASQTVASNFNLATESIDQVYNLPLDEDLTSDGLYMLTERSVYRSIDYQYLEEYGTLAHTDSLIGMFRALIDNDNYVIGTSGVYCYKDKEWQLAWNQPNVLNVEQVSPTQYFVRKPTEVGLVNHLLPDQKFLPTVSGLPSNTSGTTGVELIKNGTFLSVLNWTFANSVAYDATNKRASFTAETDGYFSQNNETLTHSIQPFFTYKLTFTVGGNPLKISLWDIGRGVTYDTNTEKVWMDEENSYVEKTVYGTGSHTLYFTAGPTVGEGGLLFYIHKTGSGPGYIDDISLKNIQVTSFLSDYKDSSTLYLGSNGSSYKTSTSSYLWDSSSHMANVLGWNKFQQDIYAVNPSTIAKVNPTFASAWTDVTTANDYYLTASGTLYTGSVTDNGPSYFTSVSGVSYTGPNHQYSNRWYGDVTIGDELVTDSDAEAGIPDIGGNGSATRCTIESASNISHSLSKSAKLIDGQDQNNFHYRYYSGIDTVLTDGTLYKGTVWVYIPSSNSTDLKVTLRNEFNNITEEAESTIVQDTWVQLTSRFTYDNTGTVGSDYYVMQIYVENSAGGDVGSGVQIYFDDLSVKELSTTDELLIPTENYVTSAGDPLIKNTEEFHSITSNESKLYATSERFIHQSVDGTTWTTLYASPDVNLTSLTVGSTDDVDVILHAGTDNGIITVTESGVATDLNSGYKFYDLNEPETYFLSIPSLQSTTTSTILNEGVDYEISDLSSIKFLKPLSFEDSAETFYTISGIYLSPTITNIYFQGFGESNPKAMLQNNIIYPYVSGYNSISDHHLKSKIWANHLAQFCWAGASVLRQQPTLASIQHGYEIMRGLPFSYQNSYYDSDWTSNGVNYLKTIVSGLGTEIVYEIPSPAQWNPYSDNQYIPQHSILVSGIHATDYQSDPTGITALVENTDNPEEKYHIIGINESNTIQDLKYSQNMLTNYVNNSIPSTFFRVIYNKAPSVTRQIYASGVWNTITTSDSTLLDSNFYNGNSIAQVKSLTSDPENDILTYRWNFLGPYRNYDQTHYNVPVISGIEEAAANITLPTPLVDSKLRFEIAVNDIYNTTREVIDIYTSGTYQFDSWGDTEFKFADLNVDFTTISGMNS